MKLEVITPEKMLFSGEVYIVMLPGTSGSLTILDSHAPLITSLRRGTLLFRNDSGENEYMIDGGFAEVNNNQVVVCVESILES